MYWGNQGWAAEISPYSLSKMVLPEGIELSTSPLPIKSASKIIAKTAYYICIVLL
jgi:hypothetical protein